MSRRPPAVALLVATLALVLVTTAPPRAQTPTAAERVAIADELSRLGRAVVAREAALGAAEAKLDALRREIATLRVRQTDTRGKLARLLGRIQRAAREPAPALLAHPGRPVEAARSAILLRAMIDDLRARRADLRAEIARLDAAARDAVAIETAARAEIDALRADEIALAAALARKSDAEAADGTDPRAAARAAAAIGAEADSLRDLAAALEAAPPLAPPVSADRPARFTEAKGRLVKPAAGAIAASDGRTTPGVYVLTRPYARVIAPWDGLVVYVGEVTSEGKVVIIEPQKGALILMEGLADVDAPIGRRVVAGEPIGRMGGPPQRSAEFLFEFSAETVARRERLYIEILQRGRPIDPADWFAPETEEVSGL